MGISKFGAGLACTVMAFGFAGVAQADFVKTVGTEAECTAQSGDIMDLNGEKHCFVPVVSKALNMRANCAALRNAKKKMSANLKSVIFA